VILHIVPDDKFIDMAYNMFEKASPNNNEFMVVTKQENFKYIKTTPITRISPLKFLTKSFAKRLSKYEFVVIHWLEDQTKQLILNAPREVKFIWIGWGGDYYRYINKKLYLPLTQTLVNDTFTPQVKTSIKQKIKTRIKKLFFLKEVLDTEKIIARINFFAPVLQEDYDLLCNEFIDFSPKYIDWNYGTLEDDLVPEKLQIDGKNILLGNSATAENNHLDTFKILRHINISDRKIICPLSYGDMNYSEKIIRHGIELFGNNFEALTDFIPINEYNKIINSCSIVIMNHLRQQAVGNIVIMLYFGAKVFLNKENPVYEFFKKNGAIIFNMEELTDKNINIELTEQEKHINKEVLKKYWARDVILEKTKKLIEIMRDKNA